MSRSETALGGERTLAALSGTEDQASTAVANSRRLQPGDKLGRYVVVGWLGRGAMGAVYRCHDPSLGRDVAVKLLEPSLRASERRRLRLISEARAMARVKHPNVISVHDSGEHEGQVFIAMELIEGPTLRAWLDDGPHPVEDVLAKFAQAAEGLSAAHRAGLIHRDFKPDNVMLARDGGRVVVMDFGLARSTDPSTSTSGEQVAASDAAMPSDLTRTGALIGTPAYMSPEQIGRLPLTAATDQFSFCVSLFEALEGKRPFRGPKLAQLAVAITHADRPSVSSRVPKHIRNAISRGLAVKPEERFGSMEDLCEVLQRRTAGRLALLAGGTLVVGAVATTVALTRPDDEQARCERGASSIESAWNQERREAIDSEFATLGLEYTAQTWSRAASLLDAYARDWTVAFTETCTASMVRGERSPALFDHQAACLTERRNRLQATLDKMEHADEGVARGAVDLITSLEAPGGCLSAESGSSTDTLSEFERDARIELAEIHVDFFAGRHTEAADASAKLLDQTRNRDLPLLEADLLLLQGRSQAGARDDAEALASFEEALRLLATDGGARSRSIAVWKEYVPLLALSVSRPGEARALLFGVELAAGADSASVEDRALLEGLRARIALSEQRPRQAVTHARAALQLIDDNGLPESQRRFPLSLLTLALFNAGEAADGLVSATELVALNRRLLGPSHPHVARSLLFVAKAHRSLQDNEAALEVTNEAISILRPLGSSAEVLFATALIESVYGQSQDASPQATATAERALEIFERRMPPGSVHISATLATLARLEKNPDKKLRWLERAEAEARAGGKATAFALANILGTRGRALVEVGESEEALRAFQQSAEIFASTGEGLDGCGSVVSRAHLLVDLERTAEALTASRDAITLCNKVNGQVATTAYAHFALARALALPGPLQDEAAAIAEAKDAEAAVADLRQSEVRDEVHAWLKEHSPNE